VIVYVDGANLNRFAGDSLSWDTFGLPGDNPDILFVQALTTLIKSEVCTEQGDVYAMGFSGGAFMAQTYACYAGGVRALAVFEGGFEDGDANGPEIVSRSPLNVVNLNACVSPAPAALVVHSPADVTVPVRYGQAAAAHWRARNSCATSSSPSTLDADCVEFDGCGNRVALCQPACPALDINDLDGDTDVDECDPTGHVLWKPQGPSVAATFLRRFFPQ
jgi:poly(3-hydroxybutyrate) depolymerase